MLRPTRTLGAISLAAVVAAFGAVSVAHAGVHTDSTTACSSTGVCKVFENKSTGAALEAETVGEGKALYVESTAAGGDGIDANGTYIGVIGRAAAGTSGYPFVATDQSGDDLFFIDGDGDVYYTGSIGQFMKTNDNKPVLAYTAQAATRTIEDTGTAQIVDGQGRVSLDPTFAKTIDLHSAYRVFLTPNGDTKGLFVSQKSPGGFVVRETQGGHGTLSFDYRIVAAPSGAANQRMGVSQLPALPHAR
jgi:hypothetical protein